MTDHPLCECHGVEKCWDKDVRYRAGGYWRCAVKRRERDRNNKRKAYWANPEKRQEYVRIQRAEATKLGLCLQCRQPLDCESNSRCWSCLDKQKERRAFAY